MGHTCLAPEQDQGTSLLFSFASASGWWRKAADALVLRPREPIEIALEPQASFTQPELQLCQRPHNLRETWLTRGVGEIDGKCI